MEQSGVWQSKPRRDNRYRYNGKEIVNDLGLEMYLYGARVYLPRLNIFPSPDPIAEDFPWIDPYSYVWNSPLRFVDPDGRAPVDALERNCPPWICGGIAGGLVEAGTQYAINLSKGQGFLEAAGNIDGADVLAATVEGAITGGGSVVRRLATKGATMVASEIIQASVDVELDGTIDIIATEGSTKTIGQVATETAIGVGSNIVGEAIGSGLEVATTSGANKQLKTVNRELVRSMKGSRGEATRLTKQAQLNSTIKGNKVVSQGVGTITTETLDEKLKSNRP